jgi:hypothetical protein
MDGDGNIAIVLDGKVSQLITLYEKEKKHALLLRDTIATLEGQVESLETEIEALKEANRTLKLATAFKSKGDASDARKIIDGLVREIDGCITLLNR